MVYAKQIKDGKLAALMTYDFEPNFGEDSDVVVITEEEYKAILAELMAERERVKAERAKMKETGA